MVLYCTHTHMHTCSDSLLLVTSVKVHPLWGLQTDSGVWECVSVCHGATEVKLNLDVEPNHPAPLGLTDRQQSDFEVALLGCTELLQSGRPGTC